MIILGCPQCQTTFGAIEDISPGKAQCPKCSSILELQDALDRAWLTVRSGLNVLLVGVYVLTATLVLTALFGAMVTLAGVWPVGWGWGNVHRLVMPVVIVFFGTVICGSLASVAGLFLCTSAPEPSAWKRIVGTMFCFVPAIISVVQIADPDRSPFLGPSVGLLSFLIAMALFILFLKRVATLFGNERLGKSCRSFLVYEAGWTMMLAALLVPLILVTPDGASFRHILGGVTGTPFLVELLGLVALVGLVVSLVWSMRLLACTRDTIAGALEMPLHPREAH